jgi:hypothetical protein
MNVQITSRALVYRGHQAEWVSVREVASRPID